MKNKIGWCNLTFNPVWGCRNNCPYCYARAIAKRFGAIRFMEEWEYRTEHNMDAVHFKLKNSLDLIEFRPTFLYSKFEKKFPKKPQRIFVGSMSEIEFWREDWVKKVIEKIKGYPQHTFMFLTQHPEVYARYLFPSNCWVGVTVTRNKPIQKVRYVTIKRIRFLSIEPILEKIDIEHIDDFEPDWIIVGAETGSRRGKIIPEKEWVEVIIDFCNRCNRPLYIKDNLVEYYPEYGNIKEFPNYK